MGKMREMTSLGRLCTGRQGNLACRFGAACLMVLCLSLAFASVPSSASTSYVDGISDQSLPLWDGGFSGSYFGGFFRASWVGSPPSHITLARYVVQWNVMSGSYPAYRSEFESWLNDIASLGLTPDLALTSYDGVYPVSSAEYKTRLQQVLSQARTMGHSIRYVEAWNEPNNQGHESAVNAAHFTNEAYAACSAEYACTIIAGNLEDSPSVGSYEDEYRTHLSPVPTIWGVHPYSSVEERSETPIQRVVEHMPNGGTGDQLWITEVAARKCKDFNGLVENGEIGQAERAKWLVNTLIHNRHPEHVFYYEFLLKNRLQPQCTTEGADDALYVPSSDPNAPDAPRAAASYIWDGKSVPWGYTGGATISTTEPNATLTASLYPGGFLDSRYHFEYGTSTSYGSYSTEGDAGSGLGRVGESLPVGGLAPGTLYHYRVVAWNSEGASYGADLTVTTPNPPAATTESATAIQETQAALNGRVNPNWAETHYYFQYGTTIGYGGTTPAPPGTDAGFGTTAVSASTIATSLPPGTTIHYRLVASSWAGTTYANDQVFITPEAESSSRWAVRNSESAEQWVFFRASNGSIAYWLWANGWTLHELSGHPAAAGTTPTVVRDPTSGVQWVYYQGSNGTIEYWEWSNGWTFREFSGHPAATGTSPTVVRDPGSPGDPNSNYQWVYYQGSNGSVGYWQWAEGWTFHELSGHAAAAGTSPTVVREPYSAGDPNSNYQWVYYQGSNGSVGYWQWAEGWTFHELSGHAAAAGTNPTVVRDPTSTEQWVYYQGSNGLIGYWLWANAWTFHELSGHAAATGTSPTVIRDPFSPGDPNRNYQWVYYQGSNGSVGYWQWAEGWTFFAP